MKKTAYDTFINGLGFAEDPFATLNAALEPRLESYFIRPKYFTSLLGQPKTPRPALVVAPRGTGKTAQKVMLERWCPEHGALPISYDHFPKPQSINADSFSLDYHFRNVLRQGVLALIAYMLAWDITAQNLNTQSRQNLFLLAKTYVGQCNVQEIDSFKQSLLGRIESLKETWNEWREVGSAALAPLLKRIGVDNLPALPQKPAAEMQTPQAHFELFKGICKELGFSSIYVLVDRIDETEWTGNNPEKSFALVESLLKSLPTLDDPYVAWKFFIWNEIWPFCKIHARTDRVKRFDLVWTEPELEEMLRKRLLVFSDGTIAKTEDLFDANVATEAAKWAVVFAVGSPRNALRLFSSWATEQAELDPTARKISAKAVEAGLIIYCELVAEEMYPEEQIRELRRVGRASFTISYLANTVYREARGSTMNRIKSWKQSGVIRQHGSVKLNVDAGRPAFYYLVPDSRVVRVIYQNLTTAEMMRQKAANCEHCQGVVFSEFEDRLDDFICPHCDRAMSARPTG